MTVVDMRKAFEVGLQSRDKETCDRYWAQKAVATSSGTGLVAKRMSDSRFGGRFGNGFKREKICFGKM